VAWFVSLHRISERQERRKSSSTSRSLSREDSDSDSQSLNETLRAVTFTSPGSPSGAPTRESSLRGAGIQELEAPCKVFAGARPMDDVLESFKKSFYNHCRQTCEMLRTCGLPLTCFYFCFVGTNLSKFKLVSTRRLSSLYDVHCTLPYLKSSTVLGSLVRSLCGQRRHAVTSRSRFMIHRFRFSRRAD
jgi:hypothetical protein